MKRLARLRDSAARLTRRALLAVSSLARSAVRGAGGLVARTRRGLSRGAVRLAAHVAQWGAALRIRHDRLLGRLPRPLQRPLRWIETQVLAPLGFARRHRRLTAAACAAPLLFALAVNLWVYVATARYRYDRASDVPPRLAAIVPGALVYPDGRPSHILQDRLETALELYRMGRVSKIIASGDHGRTGYDEVNAMRRYLAARGALDEDLFMDHAGFDTYDTMVRARQVFCVDSAVVVTQDFHLPRSVYVARRAGIDAVGIKADRRRYGKESYNALRESVARVKSFAEVHLAVRPRYLGPRIPIWGDGRATWDAVARRDGPAADEKNTALE